MTTSACEWRAVREEDIRRAYADKKCWNDLDRITWQHPYSFKSIEQWPLDAAVIYKPTDRTSVLLGSIKAACSLEDILKTLLVKVTVVVTMCANEMKIHPEGLDAVFPARKSLSHQVSVGGHDIDAAAPFLPTHYIVRPAVQKLKSVVCVCVTSG